MRLKYAMAFSLIELLIALITISCIMAALTPVITKKLKNNAITVGGGFGSGNGGGGGATGGGGVSTKCQPNCGLCFGNTCINCKLDCPEGQYKNNEQCLCKPCGDTNCAQCDEKKCIKCKKDFGIDGSACVECGAGKFINSQGECEICPAGSFCDGKNKATCPSDAYSSENMAACLPCKDKYEFCAKCDDKQCKTCEKGATLQSNGTCVKSQATKTFTNPDIIETFEVPEGVTELEVTLVSGGAGGGGGNVIQKTQTFVTNLPKGETTGLVEVRPNLDIINVNPKGLFTWTIPDEINGKIVYVSACGGGGGSGGGASDWYTDPGFKGARGGNGGAIKDKALKIDSNKKELNIIIGGGGGGGGGTAGYDKRTDGGCSYGGVGGGNTNSISCNAPKPVGGTSQNGYNVFPSTVHLPLGGIGYANAGNNSAASSGQGGIVGGGGGGTCGGYAGCGGGGGGATTFDDSELAKNYIAPGGGGGGGATQPHFENVSANWGSAGGGGGGVGGGAGGKARFWNWESPSTANGLPGEHGLNYEISIFGNNYCRGNDTLGGGSYSDRRKFNGNPGKDGAMRISYTGVSYGSGGGGAGHIVPKQIIQVNPGDILKITVGKGGKGGAVGTITTKPFNGEDSTISSITKDGEVIPLITSSVNPSASGAKGGNIDGTGGVAGFITNGKTENKITMSGFSNTAGGNKNNFEGGAGGKTILYGQQNYCTPGVKGVAGGNGGNATGAGGCGGGGGGGNGKGGDGAPGIVIIKYGN